MSSPATLNKNTLTGVNRSVVSKNKTIRLCDVICGRCSDVLSTEEYGYDVPWKCQGCDQRWCNDCVLEVRGGGLNGEQFYCVDCHTEEEERESNEIDAVDCHPEEECESIEIDVVKVEYKGKTYFVEEETTKVFDEEYEFKGFVGRGEFKEMTLPGAEDGAEKECDHTGIRSCPCEECGDKAIGTYKLVDGGIAPLCLECKEENDYLMEEEHKDTCEEEHCKICSRGVFCDCWDRLCPWCLGNGKEWRMRKDFLVRVKAGKTHEEALQEILVEYA